MYWDIQRKPILEVTTTFKSLVIEQKRRKLIYIYSSASNGSRRLTIAVSLLHDNRAHKDLNGAHVFQWDLALAGGLDQPKSRAELLLGNGARGVNLISENQEGNTLQLLNSKQSLMFPL